MGTHRLIIVLTSVHEQFPLASAGAHHPETYICWVSDKNGHDVQKVVTLAQLILMAYKACFKPSADSHLGKLLRRSAL